VTDDRRLTARDWLILAAAVVIGWLVYAGLGVVFDDDRVGPATTTTSVAP
jgi:hypothetical protein